MGRIGKSRQWTCIAVLAAAACILSATPARAQSVEMTTVKYEGLGEVVKKHRGKVVYVNFWSFY
ncbi:MAG: hypothetical protein U0744_12500 [Gemmataceae bacterium]